MTDEAVIRRNILVLALAQTLGGSKAPIVISLGGLGGEELSGNTTIATLPVSLYNLGLALGTLPAAIIMRRFGRRRGYVLNATTGLWTAPGLADKSQPHAAAVSNASGLTPPIWLWRRVRF